MKSSSNTCWTSNKDRNDPELNCVWPEHKMKIISKSRSHIKGVHFTLTFKTKTKTKTKQQPKQTNKKTKPTTTTNRNNNNKPHNLKVNTTRRARPYKFMSMGLRVVILFGLPKPQCARAMVSLHRPGETITIFFSVLLPEYCDYINVPLCLTSTSIF